MYFEVVSFIIKKLQVRDKEEKQSELSKIFFPTNKSNKFGA